MDLPVWQKLYEELQDQNFVIIAVAMDSRKLEQVRQLFQQQIDDGLHPGAGLAVYRYGNLVLDI